MSDPRRGEGGPKATPAQVSDASQDQDHRSPDPLGAPYSSAVLPQHVELLIASGITPDVAAARSYRSADTKAQLAGLGFKPVQRRTPGLLLPAWSPVTRGIATWQLRSDEPRVDQQRGRTIKYETAAARPVVVDAHPHTWDHLGDPGVPLFVTEGIRKADSAISIGLCCVALLGVWNWRGTNDKGGKTVLPEWEAIALNGRRTYIVFDSDVMENPSVHKALARLKTFLEAKGAEVSVIYLPSGPSGVKVGLDDFLVSGHGRDDLLALASSELRPLPPGNDEDKDGGDVHACPYRATASGMVWDKPSRDGTVAVPLANFVAAITGDVTVDDGAETSRSFRLVARLGARVASFGGGNKTRGR